MGRRRRASEQRGERGRNDAEMLHAHRLVPFLTASPTPVQTGQELLNQDGSHDYAGSKKCLT